MLTCTNRACFWFHLRCILDMFVLKSHPGVAHQMWDTTIFQRFMKYRIFKMDIINQDYQNMDGLMKVNIKCIMSNHQPKWLNRDYGEYIKSRSHKHMRFSLQHNLFSFCIHPPRATERWGWGVGVGVWGWGQCFETSWKSEIDIKVCLVSHCSKIIRARIFWDNQCAVALCCDLG